jgi:hypothetical protein
MTPPSTQSPTENNHYKGFSGIKRAFATPSALTLFCFGLGSGLPFLLVSVTLSTWFSAEHYWAHKLRQFFLCT